MISSLLARARSLWDAIRRPPDVEAEMSEEFRTHIEMRADDLKRSGLTSAAARRQAKLEFGSTERYKDEARESRGLKRVDQIGVSWLDFKLGFRMLARYPGLTLVGGLSMAFAIWVGAGAFELINQIVAPTLPLDEGHRIVSVQNWDIKENRSERQALHDFVAWREQLKSIEDLGAFQTGDGSAQRARQRNLVTGSGEAEPVEVAEISASAFRVTRVPPLLGRTLVAADEDPNSPLVIVIGYDVWQRRFEGNPKIVGQRVSLGTTPATIVGVMPPKYAFPVAQSLWIPLRLNPLDFERGGGPGITMFGRLAPGVSLAKAQTELETLGRRAAADFPRTHEHLRPEVKPYAEAIMNIPRIATLLLGSSNLLLILLVVLICGNVALLMFARAATRENEITVRTALGASRGRIVMQLFAEALVLGAIAAAIGLGGAGAGIRWAKRVVEAELLDGGKLPFWFSEGLSPSTVIYALLLTLVGSLIAGVLPALKVTSGLQDRLRAAGAGGGGLKFGGIWTLVIVSQIAVTVVFPVMAIAVRSDAKKIATFDVGIAERTYLSARIDMDRERSQTTGDTSRAAYLARFVSSYEDLDRRLEGMSGVQSVTVASRLPRMYHPYRLVEVDEGVKTPLDPRWPAYRVSSAAVATDYFEVMDAPIRLGRSFTQSDKASDARTAIVNESFVKTVFGGANPVGRRVRYIYAEEMPEAFEQRKPPGPWYEVVGVAKDLGMGQDAGKNRGIYHPLTDTTSSVHIAVRTHGAPEEFGPRLRAIALAVNPALRVNQILPIYRLSDAELEFYDFWLRLTALVSGFAILLSLTGIYAVMSFTVSRRTREIGIRIALGASSRKVVAVIFKRPLIQVGLGVVTGTLAIALLLFAAEGDVNPKWIPWLFVYSLVMLGVCLLACIVPTRRALAVQPSEALRSDG